MPKRNKHNIFNVKPFNLITMSKKHKAKAQMRDARQARQARRVVNGIFIALIALMVLMLISYYVIAG